MKLALALGNRPLTSLEGLVVQVALENDEAAARRVPGPNDRSGALAFSLYDGEGRRVRRMSGLTHQSLMSSARLDESQDLDDLAPGARWDWTLDLAEFHYALPPGSFELEAEYVVAREGLDLRSERVPVTLPSPALTDLVPIRDCPILDSLSLLMRVGENGGGHWVLRQHNAGRPFAAWYSRRLEGVSADTRPFLASARFFSTENFDAAFDKWLIESDGRAMAAHRFVSGESQGLRREAPLPPGRTLLRSACYDESGALMLFMLRAPHTLEAWDWDDAGLRPRFEHVIEEASAEWVRVIGDCDFIHVVTPHRGLLYERLNLDGTLDRRDVMHTTRREPLAIEVNPNSRTVAAVFRDGPQSPALELVAAPGPPRRAQARVIELPPRVGEVGEVSFDRDEQGRFHLLVSTARRELMYWIDAQGPWRIAEGEDRFFPLVCCGTRTTIGCFERAHGYRMLKFDMHRPAYPLADPGTPG